MPSDPVAHLLARVNHHRTQCTDDLASGPLQPARFAPFWGERLERLWLKGLELRVFNLPWKQPSDASQVLWQFNVLADSCRNASGKVLPTAEKAEGAGGSDGRQKRRGRKPDTDPKADKRVWDAWQSGEHKDHEQLAVALGMTRREAKLALDRYRHQPGVKKRHKPARE